MSGRLHIARYRAFRYTLMQCRAKDILDGIGWCCTEFFAIKVKIRFSVDVEKYKMV